MEIKANNKRLESADVYRGFVMFLMMAEVLEFEKVAKMSNGSSFWNFMAWHQSHVEWVGCSLHDMIQPSFSFLVGVVLPYSIAAQVSKSISFQSQFFKAIKRSIILILLGVFLRSMHSEQTNWTFEDTLTQIGLGYPFLFLLGFRSEKFLYITTAIILFFYWLAFALYPLPGNGFDYNLVGAIKDWEHNLTGFAAHWNKNTNFASAFDQWFLNLFSREKLFVRNGGGYLTLSFIPTLCTMILGLIAGKYLKSEIAINQKYRNFLVGGIALILAGLILNFTGICPIVKRIWTPAWVLFSGGICFLFLVFFMKLTENQFINKFLYWLKVIGMNSIAAYVLAHTVTNFIHESFEINISKKYDEIFGETYESLVSGTVILVILWLILNWMYKKKIFLKI